MKPLHGITHYNSINEFYEACHFTERSRCNTFHIFRVEDTYPDVIAYMPPYTKSFYHIGLLYNTKGLKFILNSSSLEAGQTLVLAHSPEHIHSWLRVEGMKGFVINFTPDFIISYCKDINATFKFFDPTQNSAISLSEAEVQFLVSDFQNLLNEYKAGGTNDICGAYLLVILLRLSKLFHKPGNSKENAPDTAIYIAYKNMVSAHYLVVRNVSAYAKMLNVTLNHLCEVIKAKSNRTPKEFIDDRLALEIKNMLLHTSFSVSEIAYKLNFSEPANFTKFFKKQTGMSPKDFRQNFGKNYAV